MKKGKFLVLGILALAVVFSGCKQDPPAGPATYWYTVEDIPSGGNVIRVYLHSDSNGVDVMNDDIGLTAGDFKLVTDSQGSTEIPSLSITNCVFEDPYNIDRYCYSLTTNSTVYGYYGSTDSGKTLGYVVITKPGYIFLVPLGTWDPSTFQYN
jgi:hypothetical protein